MPCSAQGYLQDKISIPEGEIYTRLHAGNVQNIPKLLAAEDIRGK
jgi:hypothetical protein